ncbi:ATP-binding cassette domain-containing protein [Cryptosporangium sp. NPDC048952]|uniref:ATP-binding cassette domain-containing protein n=1 Tax=Cryptosporangium sp. NPDC048952 TaxID=3363961 RepID=UPI003719044F
MAGVRARLGRSVVLDDLTLSVESGQVVVVVGGAGATLFDTVCGFVRPEAGEITWRGAALRPRPHRLTTLGGLARTLQGVGLYGGLTVVENVLVGAAGVPPVAAVPAGRRGGVGVALLGGAQLRLRGEELREHARDSLTRLGLGDHLDAELTAVPASLHNRVVLARALLVGPELLVLDDPTAGLDATEAAALAGMLRPEAGSDRAVLVTTKDAEFAARAADRVMPLGG